MKFLGVSVLIAVSLFSSFSPSARADDDQKAQCSASNDKSIQLRREGKLMESRAELLKCATPACPDIIRETCEDRLATVNAALPSVVFDIKNAAGQAVTAASISMDGRVIAEQIDGRAIPVDPGMHDFVITSKDGRGEQRLVVREGAKDFVVSVTLASDAPPQPDHGVPQPTPVMPMLDQNLGTVPHENAAPSSTMKTTGYIVAGVGAAGLALGTVFALVAISQNGDAHCDGNDYCDKPQSRKDAIGSANVATVGFIAGGVLAAGGLALIIFSPKKNQEAPAAAWMVKSFASSGGAGMSFGRSF